MAQELGAYPADIEALRLTANFRLLTLINAYFQTALKISDTPKPNNRQNNLGAAQKLSGSFAQLSVQNLNTRTSGRLRQASLP